MFRLVSSTLGQRFPAADCRGNWTHLEDFHVPGVEEVEGAINVHYLGPGRRHLALAELRNANTAMIRAAMKQLQPRHGRPGCGVTSRVREAQLQSDSPPAETGQDDIRRASDRMLRSAKMSSARHLHDPPRRRHEARDACAIVLRRRCLRRGAACTCTLTRRLRSRAKLINNNLA